MNYSLFTRCFVGTISLMLCTHPSHANAQGSSASFQAYSHRTSAVDANGVHHQGADYKGHPPWLDDKLKSVAPEYPYTERLHHHQGRGIVRLTLDLKRGTVTQAVIAKSTGFAVLDGCAITAFQHWTWRPGKWKEIDLPFLYQLGNVASIPKGGVPIPSSR